MNQGFYEQLGVDHTASTGQVRAAYGRAVASLAQRRKACLEQGRAADALDAERANLDEAWSVLSDPVRRRRYDAMRSFADQPLDGRDPQAFWESVSTSLVHPAAAAAAKLLRVTTHLKEIGAVPVSPSASEGEPPTLVPHDEDKTAPVVARLSYVETDPNGSEFPTEGPESDGVAAPVVPLPNAIAEPPGGALRVVDGSPEASSVIVLPTDAPRQRTLSSEDLQTLVQQHGHSGALLRAVREARGMPLQSLADNTRISVRYLEAIEADDHAALPSATFVRGYVREMARQLRLEEPGLVDGYLRRLQQ